MQNKPGDLRGTFGEPSGTFGEPSGEPSGNLRGTFGGGPPGPSRTLPGRKTQILHTTHIFLVTLKWLLHVF
eukprot:7008272-Heterocapsa_arctica.AAC.1